MRLVVFIVIFFSKLSLFSQNSLDTLEGWWTMQNGQHYFEDNNILLVKFVGSEVWDMEDYYTSMVPEIGFPLQVIITAAKKEDLLEVYSLTPSPEGCED